MMRIWKCDSNWGGRAILDLFVEYQCVFFGTADIKQRVGHYKEAQIGDLIAMARGTTMIAVARMTTVFRPLRELSRVCVPQDIRDDFDESGAEPWGCEIADVYWLPVPVRNGKRMMRFFELGVGCDDVLKQWNAHLDNPRSEDFVINSRSVSLATGSNPLFLDDRRRYVVPVYQRPYAWVEPQIQRLLEDVWEGYVANERKFIGTIQLSSAIKIDDDRLSYQIIDGQQRLTTFLILLKQLGVDWTSNFRTVVNQGAAQRDWDEFCHLEIAQKQGSVNPYLHAKEVIAHWLDNAFSCCHFSLTRESFCRYLQENLIFVVVETHAGISKTLQIFNVINTAGMDLNISDLFKIRFYEYLSKDGVDDTMFRRISCCYQKVEDRNREVGYVAVSMGEVLTCFQRLLVAKFRMGSETYSLSNEQFFERLFDFLLNGKNWTGFRKELGIIPQIEDFERLVDVLLCLEKSTRENESLRIVRRMLWETRYGWYACHMLAIACCFDIVSIRDAEECKAFVEDLLRRLIPPSIAFSRVVNPIRVTRLHKLLLSIGKGDASEVKMLLHETWDASGCTEKAMLEAGLNQVIASTPAWKNLLCRLVEYLESLQQEGNRRNLYQRLFETAFDIEHIQPYTDKDDCDGVWTEWKDELNSLGNLVLLEYDINRSIHNERFCTKLLAYKNSKFVSVANAVAGHAEWTKECAIWRRKQKVQELIKYLTAESWK